MNSIDNNKVSLGFTHDAERNWLRKLAGIGAIYRPSPDSIFLKFFTRTDRLAYALETLSIDLWACAVAACESLEHLRLGNTA
jgi:hypothetical protein|tara:strand:- start:751 stop:996 length:246 start_codon:yes stop_codon:yes gene_type:complete